MNPDRLYICDGLACEVARENCYLAGGDCTHTSDRLHSIKRRLQLDFPPTTFDEMMDCQVERIDLVGLLGGYFDKKSQDLPAV